MGENVFAGDELNTKSAGLIAACYGPAKALLKQQCPTPLRGA
jgi:hypothetical protein